MRLEPPSIVSRAGEIFGADPAPPKGEVWVTVEEGLEEWRTGWVKETGFTWIDFGDKLLAVTKGRPRSSCVLCGSVVFLGRSRRGKRLVVNKNGSFHDCRG